MLDVAMVAIKWHAPRKLSKFAGSAPLAAQLQLERFPTRSPWVSQRWNGHARNSLEPETRRRDAEKTLENVVRFFGEQHHPSSIQQHTFQHLSGGGYTDLLRRLPFFGRKTPQIPGTFQEVLWVGVPIDGAQFLVKDARCKVRRNAVMFVGL